VAEPLFRLVEGAVDDVDATMVVEATDVARGPWSAGALHGGPVAALLAVAAEALPSVAPMFPARVTVELLRPVGLGRHRVDRRIRRQGRKVRTLDVDLVPLDATEPVARATVQQIRTADATVPDGTIRSDGPGLDAGGELTDPHALGPIASDLVAEGVRFHQDGVEHRSVSGRACFLEPGPVFDWMRLLVDVVEGSAPSPLARVMAGADFGNGISAVLPYDRWIYVNPDLTVTLFRLPVDEWVGFDAVTRVGDEGVGLAESAVYDRRGRIGRATQTLLLEPR
jgi:acyl-coenzyme A thioesterase PaaI-like protein